MYATRNRPLGGDTDSDQDRGLNMKTAAGIGAGVLGAGAAAYGAKQYFESREESTHVKSKHSHKNGKNGKNGRNGRNGKGGSSSSSDGEGKSNKMKYAAGAIGLGAAAYGAKKLYNKKNGETSSSDSSDNESSKKKYFAGAAGVGAAAYGAKKMHQHHSSKTEHSYQKVEGSKMQQSYYKVEGEESDEDSKSKYLKYGAAALGVGATAVGGKMLYDRYKGDKQEGSEHYERHESYHKHEKKDGEESDEESKSKYLKYGAAALGVGAAAAGGKMLYDRYQGDDDERVERYEKHESHQSYVKKDDEESDEDSKSKYLKYGAAALGVGAAAVGGKMLYNRYNASDEEAEERYEKHQSHHKYEKQQGHESHEEGRSKYIKYGAAALGVGATAVGGKMLYDRYKGEGAEKSEHSSDSESEGKSKYLKYGAAATGVGAAAYGAKKYHDHRQEKEFEQHSHSHHHSQTSLHSGTSSYATQSYQTGASHNFDSSRCSKNSATPHAYPLIPHHAGDFIVKIGSRIALKHNMTGRFLRCDTRFQSETSGQILVTAQRWNIEDDDWWQVLPANGDVFAPGIPVEYGQMIRLRHVKTRMHLHSHLGHSLKGSSQQEITAYGGEMESDDNDHWIVTPFNGGAGGQWNGNDVIVLRHKVTNQALHSHTELLSNDVQEVTCYGAGYEENDKWRVFFQ